MIKNATEMLQTDFLINNLNFIKKEKYCPLWQANKTTTIIEKFVYSNHNEVFINQEQSERPKRKCIFTLHSDKKSSFVEILDNKGASIFRGNSLWNCDKHLNEQEHLNFIKSLHSVENVMQNYS